MKGRVAEIRIETPKEPSDLTVEDMSHVLRKGFDALSGKGWKSMLNSMFGKRSAVSLKVNCLGAPGISTRPSLAYAFVSLLANARSGGNSENIIIWDRENDELKRSGYDLNYSAPGVKCMGTDTPSVGYGEEFIVNGEVGSLPSRILTDMSDLVVSMPVIKDHLLAGFTGTMKNFFGAINNPNKYHMNNCSPYILDLFSASEVKDKVVLSIMDGTYIQCHGGPSYAPRWRVPGKVVYLSLDPVAIDYAGYIKLEEVRRSENLPPLTSEKRDPSYIREGEGKPYFLGVSGEGVNIVREVVKI